LAEVEPEVYQPEVAKTLNNLGNLLFTRGLLDEAEKVCGEALEIRRHLAAAEPQMYQSELAAVLTIRSAQLSARKGVG
jgi:nephrocystin-3